MSPGSYQLQTLGALSSSLTLTALAAAALGQPERVKLELTSVLWLPRCETNNLPNAGTNTRSSTHLLRERV